MYTEESRAAMLIMTQNTPLANLVGESQEHFGKVPCDHSHVQ